MDEHNKEVITPDEFRFVNDPDTGECDAVLEVWMLGQHNQKVADGVQKITELNNGVFGPSPKRDGLALTPQAIVTMLSIAPALPEVPKSTHFIAVGEEQSCAISVSYKLPHDTHPTTHPGIHAAIEELIGERYITIKRRAL